MIELDDVTQRYATPDGPVTALDGVSLRIGRGRLAVVRGPSGCGKTTLLMAMGAMLRPTGGAVRLDGADVYAMSPSRRAALRSTRIGFVFQMFHLVPYLGVLDNVLLAAPSGVRPIDAADRALRLLDALGMSDRLGHKPGALSAGERQRTAVARALLNEPAVVLADEPTGNLDADNAAIVLDALRRYRDGGGTVVVVTHGDGASAIADEVIELRRGRLIEATDETRAAHA